MILPIYLYGQSVLRKETTIVPRDYPNLDTLIQNMFETLTMSDGCGLAAPQIGLSIKLFIVDGTVLFKEEPEKYADCENFKQVFINPVVEAIGSEKSVYSEGCLSLPGISENIKRPKTVLVTYQDEHFEQHQEEFTTFPARIIQHEYDHLSCHVFTDHLSPLRKQFVKKQLNNIVKGKEVPKYKFIR